MKMRLFFLTLIASSLFAATSFAQKAKMTPLEYNDKLASLTDSLYNMGVAWGTAFQRIAGDDKDYSQLAEYRLKISSFTVKKIAEVKREAPVGKGGEELKAAMLNFLTFEKTMVDNAFMPLEKLTAKSSQAEIDAAIEKLTADAEKEGEALKRVNTAQENFGKQNGFTLEVAEEEDK